MPGLRAERATAKETSSTKACAAALCEFRLFQRLGQAFVAQLVQLIRPETPLPQMETVGVLQFGSDEPHLSQKQITVVARPDVLMAVADLYVNLEYTDKRPECEQALARENFHLFAGLQGATTENTHTTPHTHTHTRRRTGAYTHTHMGSRGCLYDFSSNLPKRYWLMLRTL